MTGAGGARALLEVAEREHQTAAVEHAQLGAALVEARRRYGDEPTPELDAALERAERDARRSGDRLDGKARALEAARAATVEAELEGHRLALAAALPRCDRAALVDVVRAEILTAARVDAVPAVNVEDLTVTDEDLEEELRAEHVRRVDRALAVRAIRRAVTDQHRSVAIVRSSAQALGLAPPHVLEVPHEHLAAAIAIEAAIISTPAQQLFDKAPSLLLPVAVEAFSGTARARNVLSLKPAAFVAWLREAVRTGDLAGAVETAWRGSLTDAQKAEEDAHRKHVAEFAKRQQATLMRGLGLGAPPEGSA